MIKLTTLALVALLASCQNNSQKGDDDAPSGAVSMLDFQGTFVSADDYGFTVDIMPDGSRQGDFILVKPTGIATGIVYFTQSTLQFEVNGGQAVAHVFYWDWIWARGRWRLSFDDGNTLFMEAN